MAKSSTTDASGFDDAKIVALCRHLASFSGKSPQVSMCFTDHVAVVVGIRFINGQYGMIETLVGGLELVPQLGDVRKLHDGDNFALQVGAQVDQENSLILVLREALTTLLGKPKNLVGCTQCEGVLWKKFDWITDDG